MKKFILKIGIILGASFLIMNVLSLYSLYCLRNATFYKPGFVVNGLEHSKYDYIVLGASTGLTTLNTKLIDSITGFKGINLSMDDTGISSHYLMLQHFLATGHSTKYCVLAPGVPSYDAKNTQINDNDYRFMMFLNKEYVRDYYGSFDSPNLMSQLLKASYYVPAIGVSYFNAELIPPALISTIDPDRRNRFDELGNYTYPSSRRKVDSIGTKKKLEIQFTNPYLGKLQQLCKEEGIELIYYLSPLRKEYVPSTNGQRSIINHSDIVKNPEYFYDDIHVNSSGRKEVSKVFSSTLRQIMKTN